MPIFAFFFFEKNFEIRSILRTIDAIKEIKSKKIRLLFFSLMSKTNICVGIDFVEWWHVLSFSFHSISHHSFSFLPFVRFPSSCDLFKLPFCKAFAYCCEKKRKREAEAEIFLNILMKITMAKKNLFFSMCEWMRAKLFEIFDLFTEICASVLRIPFFFLAFCFAFNRLTRRIAFLYSFKWLLSLHKQRSTIEKLPCANRNAKNGMKIDKYFITNAHTYIGERKHARTMYIQQRSDRKRAIENCEMWGKERRKSNWRRVSACCCFFFRQQCHCHVHIFGKNFVASFTDYYHFL